MVNEVEHAATERCARLRAGLGPRLAAVGFALEDELAVAGDVWLMYRRTRPDGRVVLDVTCRGRGAVTVELWWPHRLEGALRAGRAEDAVRRGSFELDRLAPGAVTTAIAATVKRWLTQS
jgi:hypothetical protein